MASEGANVQVHMMKSITMAQCSLIQLGLHERKLAYIRGAKNHSIRSK
jgi:hypothetical protein